MKRTIFILTFLHLTILSFGQGINSTINRDTINSKILNDEREISVYLPPSYYSTDQKFPVLYILDGDYNFQYVSGILELQSSISENIPEMILIGISGKGTETYRKNCKPNIEGLEDKGNAEQVSDFVEKELIPFVSKKYKTANYKILAGHSIGGLFVINTALLKPNLFNNYIAISPALWWENNAINQIANKTLKTNPNYKTNVYVSLADEKGMGVDSFLSVATNSFFKNQIVIIGIGILAFLLAVFWFIKTKKRLFPFILVIFGIGVSAYLFYCYYPSNSNFKFKQFPSENHNSVGSPTYVWALKDIFKTWKGEQEYFNSSKELKVYNSNVLNKYGNSFNMQNGVLGYTIYTLQDNPTELKNIQIELLESYPNSVGYFNNQCAERLIKKDQKEQAEKLLNETIKEFPDSYESYNALAKLKIENKEFYIADSLINKALQISQFQKLRQWQINELIETKEKTAANILDKK